MLALVLPGEDGLAKRTLLQGTLSPALGKLTELRVVDLSRNHFTVCSRGLHSKDCFVWCLAVGSVLLLLIRARIRAGRLKSWLRCSAAGGTPTNLSARDGGPLLFV